MNILRTSFLTLIVCVLAACSGKATYPPLGYIAFKKLPIADVVRLRSEVLAYLNTQSCTEVQSTQTKFFEVKDLGKKATQFVDIYDCKDNVLVFMNQLNITLSYLNGKKVKTQKWRALGQGIEVLTTKKDPSLTMIWNEANIKATVVEQ